MPRGARDRAAAGLDHVHAGLFQRIAECVVGGQHEPALAALLDHGRRRAAGLRRRGIGVAHRVGRAGFLGQAVGARAGADEDFFLLGGDRADGKRGRRIRTADHQVHLVLVPPLARAVRRDVGPVLMVGRQDLDRLAQHLAAEIGNRHADGVQPARAIEVRIRPAHVGDKGDLHLVALRGRASRPAHADYRQRDGT
ncbi:hypothetical protein D9M68_678680 [compost metagenome]